MFSGKKESFSVKIDCVKQHKQRRQLLCNSKELHIESLKSTHLQIGFSKFCHLKPKWCIAVNSGSGTYVCEILQNFKLLIMAGAKLMDAHHRQKFSIAICINCIGKMLLWGHFCGMMELLLNKYLGHFLIIEKKFYFSFHIKCSKANTLITC